jgi:hypothetical protein
MTLNYNSPEHVKRFAAACWVTARFLYHRHGDDLDITNPASILAKARREIDATLAAKARGEPCNEDLIELCVGAIAVRECCPLAKEWNGTTALLRSPCAERQYDRGFKFAGDQRIVFTRIARVLADTGKMSAAQALWLADQPAPRRAA